MGLLRWDDKDPDEILDYQLDWSEELDTDTISTSTWIVPTGLTEETDSNSTTTTTVWLSGGTIGQVYTLTNRITTAGGRTYDQSVRLRVRTK